MQRVLCAHVPAHEGKEVLLKGWIHRVRRLGNLSFVLLRDRSGLIPAPRSSTCLSRSTSQR